MITQTYDLSIIPSRSIVKVHASQWDDGERKFIFNLYDSSGLYNIASGATVEVRGTKADGHGFAVSNSTHPDYISYSGSTVSVITMKQMCAAAGEQDFKLNITISGKLIASARFTLVVDADTLSDDTDTSDSELPAIIDGARTSAAQAAASATAAARSETNANNSAVAAAASASSVSTNALKAEGYAVGKQNGTDVDSTSTYYHNNSKYYSEQAKSDADRAAAYSVNVPYIGNNGNWWVWNTSDGEYVDSGVDASITLQIADVTMLDPTDSPYVTNTGTNTDPVFHLFIPRGKGITDIAKTSTSGLIDTYTITYSDSTTYTYTVTNGKTAYQSAVEGGYTGTEANFEDDLAHFEEWKDDAETAATSAANDAAYAHADALDAKTQADRAQMYADFVEPHFVIANNRLYLKDDAAGEFILANNRLYLKLASA